MSLEKPGGKQLTLYWFLKFGFHFCFLLKCLNPVGSHMTCDTMTLLLGEVQRRLKASLLSQLSPREQKWTGGSRGRVPADPPEPDLVFASLPVFLYPFGQLQG